MTKIGMIHGRFQPFTNGHMAYLKAVLKEVDEVIIGITNPVMEEAENVDSHRHLASANPYSFYERLKMVQNSIIYDDEIRHLYNQVLVVPFPINKPEYWKFLIPYQVVQYVNIIEDWDKRKKDIFLNYGYEVKELLMPRITSATEVRKYILEYNNRWEELVPLGCYRIIKEHIKY